MEPRTENELNLILLWAGGCRQAAGSGVGDAQLSERILYSAWAYIGGAMTVLTHLELITAEEHREWQARFQEALGDPPGGWATISFT